MLRCAGNSIWTSL